MFPGMPWYKSKFLVLATFMSGPSVRNTPICSLISARSEADDQHNIQLSVSDRSASNPISVLWRHERVWTCQQLANRFVHARSHWFICSSNLRWLWWSDRTAGERYFSSNRINCCLGAFYFAIIVKMSFLVSRPIFLSSDDRANVNDLMSKFLLSQQIRLHIIIYRISEA